MSYLFTLLSKERVTVAHLESIYNEYGRSPGFSVDALAAMRQLDPELAWRAAWLLCRCARDKKLGEAIQVSIVASAEEMTLWIARLILCQLFSHTGPPITNRDATHSFLADCFSDRRVIVRAWAITALARFRDDPKYQKTIASMIRTARRDPRKSMQARLRHLRS